MSQGPTDKFVNVRRSIMNFMKDKDLAGARFIDARDQRQTSDIGKFARFTVQKDGARPAGPGRATGRTTKESLIVSVECYAPDITNGQPTPMDAADGIADAVSQALYRQNIQITDFAGSNTATGTYIQFHTPPIWPEMPAIKGWYRAAVRFPANWFAEQT